MMDASNLGRRLALMRRERGLTQHQLAQRVGATRGYISRIERGQAPGVSLNLLARIAQTLGVSLADLTGAPPSPPAIPAALRELAIEGGLPYPVVEKLAAIPEPGHEPQSVEGWRALYQAVKSVVEGEGE